MDLLCFGSILSISRPDQQWKQALFSVSLEGLGLGAAVDHVPAVYVCPLVVSQHLKESILEISSEHCSLVILVFVSRRLYHKYQFTLRQNWKSV